MYQIIKERPKIGPVGRVPENFGTRRVGRFTMEDEEEPLPVAPGAVFLLALAELVAVFEGPVKVEQLDPLITLGTVTIFWFSRSFKCFSRFDRVASIVMASSNTCLYARSSVSKISTSLQEFLKTLT